MIKNFMSMGKFVGDINTPEEMFKLISSLLKLNTCNADDVTQYNGLISRDVLAYLKEDIDSDFSDNIKIIKRSSLASNNSPQKLIELLVLNINTEDEVQIDIDKNISKENGRIPVTISKVYNVAEAC